MRDGRFWIRVPSRLRTNRVLPLLEPSGATQPLGRERDQSRPGNRLREAERFGVKETDILPYYHGWSDSTTLLISFATYISRTVSRTAYHESLQAIISIAGLGPSRQALCHTRPWMGRGDTGSPKALKSRVNGPHGESTPRVGGGVPGTGSSSPSSLSTPTPHSDFSGRGGTEKLTVTRCLFTVNFFTRNLTPQQVLPRPKVSCQ